jgi:hypothetical protein
MVFSWVCCFCFCCSSTVTNSVALYLGLLFFWDCCSLRGPMVLYLYLLFFTRICWFFLPESIFFTETWASFFLFWTCCSLIGTVVLYLSLLFFTWASFSLLVSLFFTEICNSLPDLSSLPVSVVHYLALLFFTWIFCLLSWHCCSLPGSVVLNPVILYLLITAQVLMSGHLIEIFKKIRL